jgi:hypothetical protein
MGWGVTPRVVVDGEASRLDQYHVRDYLNQINQQCLVSS